MLADADQYGLFYEGDCIVENIGQYILSVIAAAVVCSSVIAFIGSKGSLGPIIKMVCGVFLLFTAVAPWARIQLNELIDFTDAINVASMDAVETGEGMAKDAASAIIKSRCEAYILDKAADLGLTITADVILDNQDLPEPCAVQIVGAASPYARSRLMQYIANDLGIPEEAQKWT